MHYHVMNEINCKHCATSYCQHFWNLLIHVHMQELFSPPRFLINNLRNNLISMYWNTPWVFLFFNFFPSYNQKKKKNQERAVLHQNDEEYDSPSGPWRQRGVRVSSHCAVAPPLPDRRAVVWLFSTRFCLYWCKNGEVFLFLTKCYFTVQQRHLLQLFFPPDPLKGTLFRVFHGLCCSFPPYSW